MEVQSLLLVFLAYVSYASGAEPEYISNENATYYTNGSFYDPLALKLRNELVLVSFPKINADVVIKFKSNLIPNKRENTCNVTIPVAQDRDLVSLRAKALGNDKILVTFVETDAGSLMKTESTPRVHFYVVDLFGGCGYKHFSKLFDHAVLQFFEPIQVIPYEDTFDVFVKSYERCEPPGSFCVLRFNTEGDQLDTSNFNFNTAWANLDLIKMYSLEPYTPSKGYVYVSSTDSKIKILDADFNVTNEIQVNGYILTHAVLQHNDNNTDIDVCIQVDETSDSHVECKRFDSRLKLKFTAVMKGWQYYFSSKRLYGLADGSSLFVYFTRDNKVISLIRRIHPDGRVSKSLSFTYDCESFNLEPLIYFVELKKKACFSFVCKYKMITHCVDLLKAEDLYTFV